MIFAISFLLPLLLCFMFIWLNSQQLWLGNKNLRDQPQTLHKKSVSRYGGIALYVSFFLLGLQHENNEFLILVLAVLPAFLSGLIDDLGFEIRPIARLFLQLPTPIIIFYLGIKVYSVEIGFIDNLLTYDLFSLFFLIICIMGMTNAFNLIDGINGQLVSYILSLIFAVAIFPQLISLDFNLGWADNVLILCIGLSLIGFLVLNFPFGKIFLGDAGAYFLGALVSVIIIRLWMVNDFSPWAAMILLSYPFTDLVFSVYRKKFITRNKALEPDAFHLHHLVYRRLRKIKFRHERAKHFFVVLFLLFFNTPYILAGIYFSSNTMACILIFLSYLVAYILIYFSLSPRFLLSNGK